MRKKYLCLLIAIIIFTLNISPVFANPSAGFEDPFYKDTRAFITANKLDGQAGRESDSFSDTKSNAVDEDSVEDTNFLEEELGNIVGCEDAKETTNFLVAFTQPLANSIISDSQTFICGFKTFQIDLPDDREAEEAGKGLKNESLADKKDQKGLIESKKTQTDMETSQAEEEKTITIVILARYNEETKKYEEYKNAEGESRWEIGSFGLFTKAVDLFKGINKLKLVIIKVPVSWLKSATFFNKDNQIETEGESEEEGDLQPEDQKGKNWFSSIFAFGEEDEDFDKEADNKDLDGNVDEEKEKNPYELIVRDKDKLKEEEPVFEAGKNLQITYFSINILNEAVKNQLINKPAKIGNIFTDIFSQE